MLRQKEFVERFNVVAKYRRQDTVDTWLCQLRGFEMSYRSPLPPVIIMVYAKLGKKGTSLGD